MVSDTRPVNDPAANDESGEPGGESVELLAGHEDKNVRLDRFVAGRVPDLSRTYLQSLIEQGLVRVDGQVRRPSFKMTPGERVLVTLPEIEQLDVAPEAIPLDILFEDRELLVINKPAGMVVHPAPGHSSGTLVNAVLYYAPDVAVAGTQRPGIVHRLDKDTSGVMIVAKTDRALHSLTSQWQDRTVVKEYLALATGSFEEQEATVDAPIGRDPANRQKMAVVRHGKPAVSHFSVLERLQDATYIQARIETGRTHQIRVHLEFIGKPIVGDGVYGSQKGQRLAAEIGLTRQFLHASRLELTAPDGHEMVFTAPLASDLQRALDRLRTRDEGT